VSTVARLLRAPARALRSPARALRAPALHFALLGALLFVAFGDGRGSGERARPPIVLDAARIDTLVARYERSTGLRATRDDARALADREVDDEVLYQEAMARGLDRGDRSVRWRLVEKMSFVSDGDDVDADQLLGRASDLGLEQGDRVVRRILIEKMRFLLRHDASVREPSDTELVRYLEEHRERFIQPARVRFSHVLLTEERHPGELDRDAWALRGSLQREGVGPQAASMRGDPFPMDRAGIVATQHELEGRFGPAFAEAIATLPPGSEAGWSAPIASPFGRHLVWVEERLPERLPPLAEVRGRVLYGWLAERREAALADRLRALRSHYEIHVQEPASVAQTGGEATP
jgi:parvulin-like peptidyl-prolyl isomerase